MADAPTDASQAGRPGLDGPKALGLSFELHDYLVAHGTPPDEVLQGLIEETQTQLTGYLPRMQIPPEEGALMTLLTRLIGARIVVEVGTFTGYSTLCLARGLPADGKVIACDLSEEWTAIGRPFWEKAGVADRIDLRIGPAIETIRAMPMEAHIDLVFLDADKENYSAYYDELLPRLRRNGLILVDNVLWMGMVLDEAKTDPDTVGIRDFNDKVAADDRVDCVMTSTGDGVTLLRKR